MTKQSMRGCALPYHTESYDAHSFYSPSWSLSDVGWHLFHLKCHSFPFTRVSAYGSLTFNDVFTLQNHTHTN